MGLGRQGIWVVRAQKAPRQISHLAVQRRATGNRPYNEQLVEIYEGKGEGGSEG